MLLERDVLDLVTKLVALRIRQARRALDERIDRAARMVVLGLLELAISVMILVVAHLAVAH